MDRRLMLPLAVLGLWMAGCASGGQITSEEAHRIRLEELRRICYSCRGLHDWECGEANLRYYLGRPPTALCGGPGP